MEWKVAPSYQSCKILTIDEAAHKARVEQRCDRCGGTGYLPTPVDNGVCYKCGGAGVSRFWVKAYTEKEYEKYMQNQSRSRERKAKAAADKIKLLEEKSEENKLEVLAMLGCDTSSPIVYLVCGENTYSIKDSLKAQGCRYCKELGWYSYKEIEIPDNCYLAKVDFDKLYSWNYLTKKFNLVDDAKNIAETAIKEVLPKSKSEFIGEVKERIRDLQVTLTGSRPIESYYGSSLVLTFKHNDDVLVWITSSSKYSLEIGDNVLLTGTIKEHKIYNGVKQTTLSRCIIKDI